MTNNSEVKIAVVGLGYVGLPLAVAFGEHYPTIGYDINGERIAELNQGLDRTLELTAEELRRSTQLSFSADLEELRGCTVYIITVPTPIDTYKNPDLGPLHQATASVASVLAPGDCVVYESTVYPGATEEVCVPILENQSGLTFNQDFFVGYSPERINPGDKSHRLADIVKITAGSTPEAARFIDSLYRRIVTVGTHLVSSIKVAEAAKVIENTQRDVNIALINELALIFNLMGIDTQEVLEAAGTKWNFLPFRPGLVGGHCIGVDPYYLTFKVQQLGYHPEIILAGRRLNDGMGAYVAERVIKQMTRQRLHVVDAEILVMGLTFKENCPDIRNTRVIDIIRELEHYNAKVTVYDPWVNPEEARREYGIDLIDKPVPNRYDAIVLAVAHRQFVGMGVDAIRALGKAPSVLFDVKYLFSADQADARL